jgi:hypothetical protein
VEPRTNTGAREPIPRARALCANGQSIGTRTPTPVAFDSEAWDTDGLHDAARNPTRLTARTAGLYVITAGLAWQSNPMGWRAAVLRLDGTVNAAWDQRLAVNGAETIQAITAQHLLAVGGYVELVVEQSSGRSLTIGGRSQVETNLSLAWLGP